MKSLLRRITIPVALSVALPAGPALAERVLIRSGEHAGFSRIVLDLREPSEWQLGRTEDGYSLLLERAGVTFDIDRVFRMIPRTRIADLTVERTGNLAIRVGCDCHANAFVTERGALVIDVADGAAPPGSRFEESTERSAREQTSTGSTQPGTVQAHTAAPSISATSGATVDFQVMTPSTEGPQLVDWWRATENQASRNVGGKRDSGTDLNSGSLLEHTDASKNNEAYTHSTRGEEEELGLPLMTNARVSTAQSELLRQLGRAASQGLLELELEADTLPRVLPRATNGRQPTGELPVTDEAGIHAETSMDRDRLSTFTRAPLTADGGRCLSDQDFDLSLWGDERPASIQIAERRLPLVGEFDRATPEAVRDLARLYLFLGFGAEARAVLRAFDLETESSSTIAAMSDVLDGRTPDTASELLMMTGCDTAASLWAVLVWPELPAAAEVNESAVLRAFSALPIHLRRHLGPGLTSRLLDTGRKASARAVRDAIARAPGDSGAAFGMIEAGIKGADGDAETAEAKLDALARLNDPMAADALVLAIRSRLERGAPVPVDLADIAEALAFERQNGADGPLLNQVHILARASSGRMEHAFASLRRWLQEEPSELQPETARRLFAILPTNEDEAAFLNLYFANRDLLKNAAPDSFLKIDLAERLMAAGLGQEASALLKGEAALSEHGRRIIARAAIAAFDPATAIAKLHGASGKDADRIRAQALALVGDHKAAASEFEKAGDLAEAGRESWRGGDWERAAAHAPDAMREIIDASGQLSSEQSETAQAAGTLAAGRSLIAQSRDMRSRLDALLRATKGPGG